MKVFHKQQIPPEDNLDRLNAVSTTDCTGLITVPPESDEEYNAYQEVYNFAPKMPVDPNINRSDIKTDNGQ